MYSYVTLLLVMQRKINYVPLILLVIELIKTNNLKKLE